MEMKYKGRKALFVAVTIYLLGVVVVMGGWLTVSQHESLSEFDKRLMIAAESLPGLLPKDFHDRTLDKDSIGPEEDQQNLDNLSTHARSGGFAYLYTYVMDKGRIYFTASSYTDEDVTKDKVSRYWTAYPEGNKAYFDAINSTEPVFVTASDRWGSFRTVLIPRRSPNGNPYVIGADIDISEIDRTMWKQVFWVLVAAFLLLLFAVPMAITLRQTLVSVNNDLEQRVVERTTELLKINKRFQDEIRNRNETEEKYRLLFENSVEGIYQASPEGRFIAANPSFLRFFGFNSLQELFDHFKDIDKEQYLNPEDWITFRRIVETEGLIRNFETQLLRKDGTPIWVSLNSRAVRDQTGALLCFEGFMQNITERKRAEAEQEKLQAQLAQSRKMETIGTLAGGIAHDFNNILSGILGYAQLAEMNLGSPVKIRSHLSQIIKGAHRAADLTQQILIFSRQTEYEKQPLSLYLVLKEALKLLRSSIPSTIDITETIVSKSKIHADPTQMHQVIMNLCTNAYHAMGEMGGMLTVRLNEKPISGGRDVFEQEIKEGLYLELEVTDTGHGMDDEILQKAFDPYFTTKDIGKGTGFGLALVHAIIEEHGGHIKVQSRVGKGTGFYIYLPVIADPDANRQAGIKNEKMYKGGSERLMVVDDEEDIRTILQEFLTTIGYKVSIFENGASAFKAFQKNPDQFDLIVTDMTMPQMTGRELAKKIISIRKNFPVILCTGYSETVSEAHALEIGIRRYLTKPLSNDDLAVSIREILDEI
jgi:PAS domain S-box-containing protein